MESNSGPLHWKLAALRNEVTPPPTHTHTHTPVFVSPDSGSSKNADKIYSKTGRYLASGVLLYVHDQTKKEDNIKHNYGAF